LILILAFGCTKDNIDADKETSTIEKSKSLEVSGDEDTTQARTTSNSKSKKVYTSNIVKINYVPGATPSDIANSESNANVITALQCENGTPVYIWVLPYQIDPSGRPVPASADPDDDPSIPITQTFEF